MRNAFDGIFQKAEFYAFVFGMRNFFLISRHFVVCAAVQDYYNFCADIDFKNAHREHEAYARCAYFLVAHGAEHYSENLVQRRNVD